MIIITGASRGIGEYLFNSYLTSANEPILGTYLNSKPQNSLEMFVKLDISDYEQVDKLVQEKYEFLNRITLINCAGITYNSVGHKSDPKRWKNVIDVNLTGTYNMIRGVLPIMREQKYGRIINFSSVVAQKPTPGISAYAASKSALWGLSKSIAVENAALNITINNINLGYSTLGMIDMVPEEYKEKILQQIPARKFCDPQDILNTVNYLNTTPYITGSSIDISGGLV